MPWSILKKSKQMQNQIQLFKKSYAIYKVIRIRLTEIIDSNSRLISQ